MDISKVIVEHSRNLIHIQIQTVLAEYFGKTGIYHPVLFVAKDSTTISPKLTTHRKDLPEQLNDYKNAMNSRSGYGYGQSLMIEEK